MMFDGGLEERVGELWCMAVVKGICPDCGRPLVMERKVNRSWVIRDKLEEPVFFGYMGDCLCGRGMDGLVEWPWMWVGKIEQEG